MGRLKWTETVFVSDIYSTGISSHSECQAKLLTVPCVWHHFPALVPAFSTGMFFILGRNPEFPSRHAQNNSNSTLSQSLFSSLSHTIPIDCSHGIQPSITAVCAHLSYHDLDSIIWQLALLSGSCSCLNLAVPDVNLTDCFN